jgi:hypothetical protein
LKLDCDRIGFKWADPDGQISIAVGFFEDDYSVLGHQADPNTVNRNLDHISLL